MNISEETRARILQEDRSTRAKKAAATLRKRFGKGYFKKKGAVGGSKSKQEHSS